MSETPLPMDGYVRVSAVAGRSGERFQSPDEQRSMIEGWAQAHGVRIAAWHEDLDRSGGTMDRPGMNLALSRIEAGLSGGVVVARLDRFARTVIGGLTTIAQLHDRGARVVSVAEQLDPATPMGRAMLGLLLIMAEWQRDQASEYLGLAQARAASAGRFPGRTPYGYRRDEEGRTIVDAPTAAVVLGIFEARASGTGWRSIADGLVEAGVLTATGRERWAPSAVQGIVWGEAPLGVFRGPRGLRVEDAWPAIVDRDLWDRANAVKGTRDDSRRYQDRALAGIVRCANCRSVMARARTGGFVSYVCRRVGCTERCSVSTDILDEHVGRLVDERLARIVLEPRVADDDGEAERTRAARDAAQREVELWRDDVGLRAALGDQDWREGMLARARARDDAEVALAELRARGGLHDVGDLPDGVIPRLGDLPWGVRRSLVETLLHAVWVRPSAVRGTGARQHVVARSRVTWRDDADRPELPTRNGAESEPVRW